MIRRIFRLWPLVCLLGAPAAYAKAPERWQSVDYLLASFVEIAMRSEYLSGQSPVRKWHKPVNYFFVHRVADQALHEQLSNSHLAHLSAITGLAIKQAENRPSANVLIVFSTEANLQNELFTDFGIRLQQQRRDLFRNSVCLARFTMASTGEINRAIVLIPVDRARAHAKLVACIVEELTQVLGLPNDSEKVFPSIFNDKSVNSLLTGLDYLLLKMLYDPRVKAGMNQAEALPVLRKIALEFKAEHKFETAEKDVRTDRLYELLN
jgi:Protein of unknown function (DUF2927)